jgi:DNA-binding MarR family transcriptional regulator
LYIAGMTVFMQARKMIVADETIVKAKRGARASRAATATPLDRFMLYNLSLLAAKVAGSIAVEYQRAAGLALPEARVMTVLGSLSPVSSNAVVHHTSMDKATVSRAIVRLIRLGLVTRTADPRDRRLVVLGFTPKGRRTHAKLTETARAWQAWLVAGLPSTEQERFNRTLLRLLDRVRGGNGDHVADRRTERRRSSRAL